MVPADCPLGQQELDVLTLFSNGWTHKEIGDRYGIAGETVRGYTFRARRRLRVRTNLEAILTCVRHGWIILHGISSSEAVQLQRIEQLLAEIDNAIELRDRPLSNAQRAYLEAFEKDFLRSPWWLPDDRREVTTKRLQRVLAEANITPEGTH